MKFTRKGFLAILTGAIVLVSSSSIAFASQSPVALADKKPAYAATEAVSSQTNIVRFTMRKWYPDGLGGNAYQLNIQTSSPDIVKLEYRVGVNGFLPSGEFYPLPVSGETIHGNTSSNLAVEVRATMKSGQVILQTYTYPN